MLPPSLFFCYFGKDWAALSSSFAKISFIGNAIKACKGRVNKNPIKCHVHVLALQEQILGLLDCVDGMLWNICVGAHMAWQCRLLLLLSYWPPGGTASSMPLWERTLQRLRTSAWWAKYITHCSFTLTRQVVRAEARVSRRILACSWRHHRGHHPRTYQDWKHHHRQTNTKAQKHSIMTIVADNGSVIKLQIKQIRKNPSWRVSSLRPTVTCTWISLPARHFAPSAVQQSSASRLVKPASAACQSASLWLCVGFSRLTARQADTARRWGDRHHGYTRGGWQHLGVPRQRVLKDQCAAFCTTRWGTLIMK